MSYVLPKDVKTPKKHVKGIHVLYDGGEGSFSLAILDWAGEREGNETVERLSIRWNGYDEYPKGYPCAMGNPAWFNLPQKLEAVLKARAIELNEEDGKAKTINISNQILEHISQEKTHQNSAFGFTQYTTSQKLSESELIELEKILNQKMVFFLKTDNPEDAFTLQDNGDLTIKLNFINQ